jgi:acetyl-CoA carboxylase biotin carboxyl carrier protein
MAKLNIAAETAGTVWKVTAQIGDQVGVDDPVVILESMKMEIPVTSEKPGVVTQIFVKEGETIEEGTLVAEITV